MANKATVAEAVARLITQIDYLEFMRTVRFDFGTQPDCLLFVTANGLEVARLKTK